MHLDATLDPVDLAWDATFTLAVGPDFSTDITVDARLAGTLTLPGLTEAGQPAVITLVRHLRRHDLDPHRRGRLRRRVRARRVRRRRARLPGDPVPRHLHRHRSRHPAHRPR
ncbi:MAG: hypothetical protein M5U19_07360 [Microthrixaceae bacterium]|nr:hypothetical protein [Microthrixaceae bacterium]